MDLGTPVNTPVLKIQASDKDEGLNGVKMLEAALNIGMSKWNKTENSEVFTVW